MWIVAIPSYKREKVLKKKTLATMLRGGVSPSKIYIFVASKEEEQLYSKELEKGTYKEIIVGKLGLVNQRDFISSYFPKDTQIVECDDDLRDIFEATSLKIKRSIKDLSAFFDKAFKRMKEAGANLWGVYPAPNPFYMYKAPEVSSDLKYIPGGMFGYRNTKNKRYDIELGDAQEDKERTIKYFMNDGTVVRFNHISYATTNFSPGGLGQDNERIKAHEVGAKKLEAKYPQFVRAIVKKGKKFPTGLWDIQFRKGAKAETGSGRVSHSANYTIEELLGIARGGKTIGSPQKNEITEEDRTDESIHTIPIRNKEKYNETRQNLLDALSKMTVPPIPGGREKTGNMKQHINRGDVIGTKGRTITFGFGDNRHGWNHFRTNDKYPDVYKAIIAFGNQVVPKGWEYQTITLNHNAKAKKHIDRKNVGASVIIGIGNYSGGELRVFSPDSSKHKDYDIHDKPTMFNGGLLPHETQPFEGEGTKKHQRGLGRYTMIFYRQQRSPPKNAEIGIGKGQPSDAPHF